MLLYVMKALQNVIMLNILRFSGLGNHLRYLLGHKCSYKRKGEEDLEQKMVLEVESEREDAILLDLKVEERTMNQGM